MERTVLRSGRVILLFWYAVCCAETGKMFVTKGSGVVSRCAGCSIAMSNPCCEMVIVVVVLINSDGLG